MHKLTILHTADWHLGKNRKHADYLEQQRMMLQGILEMTVEHVEAAGPDELVWLIVAEDVFDRNEDTARDEFVLPILHILYPLIELEQNHPKFSFYIIDGNHDRQPYDPSNPHAQASVVTPLAKMAPGRVAVAEPMYVEEHKLLLVPFAQHSEKSLAALLHKHPARFMVLHECCAGIATDTGWKPPRDQEHYIDMGRLLASAPDLDAVFMGDIHLNQPLDKKGICHYSGSPITLDHGHKMPKGVLVHEFELEDGRWVRAGEPELKSLIPYAPGLKYHVQIGLLDDPDVLPLSILSRYREIYLQMTVSADAHARIMEMHPDLFSSSNVAWEYQSEDIVQVMPADREQGESQQDYYTPLINQWVQDNGKDLTTDEKEQAMVMLAEDFSKRS